MKKLFKMLSVLKLLAELRGHSRARRGYRRSPEYYPLYGSRRGSLLQRALHHLVSRRSY